MGDNHVPPTTNGQQGGACQDSKEITPGPGYVMVIGLHKNTNYENFLNYMEARADAEVRDVIWGPSKENAVVIFGKKPDHKKLQQKISERPLEGKLLEVIELSPPTSIIVSSKELKEFTTEALMLHFESKRYNGGELVEEEIQKTEEGCYIVTFKDSDVAANVCTIEHTIDKITLNVSPFFRCEKGTVWNTSVHEVVTPTPFKHPMDLEIVKYIQLFPKAKEAVQTAMKNVHAAIEPKENYLLITCILTPDVKDCRRLMTSWRQNAEQHLNKFLSSAFKKERISIMYDIWNDFRRNNSDIMVYEDTENDNVLLIGFYDTVMAVHKELLEKERKLVRQKNFGTDSISLQSAAKMRLLEKCGFLKRVKEKFSDLDFELSSEGIVLSGVREDRNSAKVQILEELRQLDEPAEISDATEHFRNFIQKPHVRNYLLHKMELMNYTVDWDVTERGQILIYGIPIRCAHDTAVQIKRIVKETKIPFSDAVEIFLASEKWERYHTNGESGHDGSVEIIIGNDQQNAILIGTEGIYARVLEDLSIIINMNTVEEEEIPCDSITKKFMETFWKTEDYVEVEKNSGDKHVKILLLSDKLNIRGTKDGLQKAKKLLKNKTSKLTFKSHSMKRVGIKEALFSMEQNGTLGALGKEHRCLIYTQESNFSSQRGKSTEVKMDDLERTTSTCDESMMETPPKTGPYRCRNGLIITLIKGQLALEKVNVIVCATSRDLNLSTGAASKSLLAKGGMDIQKDCNKKYPDGINEGDVVDIRGRNLNCDKVYLTVLPDWKRSNDGQSLRDVVVKCLRQANSDSMRSIAFTAMGTGQLSYPKDKVASLMYDACIEFDSQNSDFSLRDVHFVIHEKDEDSIKAFERQEINMLCGGARPKKSSIAVQQEFMMETPPKPSPYRCRNGLIIALIKGQLALEKVNVIVCATSRDLNLSTGAASKSLLAKGGTDIQKDCNKKYPDGINEGDVVDIRGRNLNCDKVYLTVLPDWKRSNDGQSLRDVVVKCLMRANGDSMKSIAFTAMGTGQLSYPKDKVASLMYDACIEFDSQNSKFSLRDVHFVIHEKDEDSIKAFRGYLKVNLLGVNTRRDRVIATHSVTTQPGNKPCNTIDLNDNSACTVGKMNVRVCAGDLLDEVTDAIVNSVDEKFSFRGGVAASLRKRCQQGLEDTCRDKKNLAKLHKSGVVITGSFGLKCKKIIHVKFQDQQPAWKKVIVNCLKKANKHKLTSIAFPVLGTGGGRAKLTADSSAEMFFEALLQFVDQCRGHNLQTVNLVVHYKQPEIIPEIKKVMANFSMRISKREMKGTIGKILERMKDIGQDVRSKLLTRRGGDEGHQCKPAPSHSQMSTATIQVYSDTVSNIDNCITDLEKSLNKAFTSKQLNDELIAKMSQTELEEFFKTDLPVEFEFAEKQTQFIIKGTPQNIVKAQDMILEKLRKIARKDSEEKEAEQLHHMVQWQYEDITSKELKPYDKLTNLRIEKAFKNDQARIDIKYNDTVFIVDFKKFVEYSQDDESDRVKIMRKDILKANICSLPKIWQEMQEKEHCRRVILPNQNQEYKQMEKIFLTEAKTGPYSTKTQNIQVVKIERIQNKTLYWQYSAKKNLMENQYKDKPNVTIERKLWHGTSHGSIDGICTHGFNRSYCGKNGTWYGHGVYFATNASYSAQDWLAAGNKTQQPGKEHFIFYVSVCVGQYVQGHNDMRVLPPKDKRNPSDIYDSAVNNVQNVEEIVIFNDTQAYPDYLITFTTY